MASRDLGIHWFPDVTLCGAYSSNLNVPNDSAASNLRSKRDLYHAIGDTTNPIWDVVSRVSHSLTVSVQN